MSDLMVIETQKTVIDKPVTEAFRRAWNAFTADWLTYVLSFMVVFLLSVATLGLLAPMLFTGYAVMCLKGLEGQKVEVGEPFMHLDKFVPSMVAALLFLPLFLVGAVALIVGAVVVTLLFSFTPFILAERDMDGVTALRTSYGLFMEHAGPITLTILAVTIVNIVGLSLPVLGLVLGPFGAMTVAAAYDIFRD